jgi:hypothetical protein
MGGARRGVLLLLRCCCCGLSRSNPNLDLSPVYTYTSLQPTRMKNSQIEELLDLYIFESTKTDND